LLDESGRFLADVKQFEQKLTDPQLREEASARVGDEAHAVAPQRGPAVPPEPVGLNVTTGRKLLSLFDWRTMVMVDPAAFPYGDATYRRAGGAHRGHPARPARFPIATPPARNARDCPIALCPRGLGGAAAPS
jgi:hypothetical protein